MKIKDLNNPNVSMTGGNDLTLWAVTFGILVVFVVVMLVLNRNKEES